jgi:hypothetical protein
MTFVRHLPSALAAACAAAVLSACVVAPPPPPPPARHPAYLHALTDLRDARWNLEHRPGDAAVSQQEDIAIVEIDRAIADARAAAAEDGKNLADHPPEDARLDRRGRLHHAVELLHKAHQDIAQAEDNPATRELRNRIVGHIDVATHAAEHALHDAEQGL